MMCDIKEFNREDQKVLKNLAKSILRYVYEQNEVTYERLEHDLKRICDVDADYRIKEIEILNGDDKWETLLGAAVENKYVIIKLIDKKDKNYEKVVLAWVCLNDNVVALMFRGYLKPLALQFCFNRVEE